MPSTTPSSSPEYKNNEHLPRRYCDTESDEEDHHRKRKHEKSSHKYKEEREPRHHHKKARHDSPERHKSHKHTKHIKQRHEMRDSEKHHVKAESRDTTFPIKQERQDAGYDRAARPRETQGRHEESRRYHHRTDQEQQRQQNERASHNRRREETRRRREADGPQNWAADGAVPSATVKTEDKSKERDKPNFGLSGKLTEDTNTYRGVVIKYNEPPEARKPKRRWRLYPFKGEEALNVLHIHRQSAFLLGRDRRVADIPVDHPSCSKQHAVLQFRLVPFQREDGTKGRRVRPYIIDLGSANGTYVNNKRIDSERYVELLEKDVIKFGYSTREYVIIPENANTQELHEDQGIEGDGQDPD